jgi:sec-independent protein translocase protein TatA
MRWREVGHGSVSGRSREGGVDFQRIGHDLESLCRAECDRPRIAARLLLKYARLHLFSFQDLHMGSMSLMHWLVVLAIVLVLFGAGKLPRVMGDFAKGIKAFKTGMKEEEQEAAEAPQQQVSPPSGTATSAAAAGTPGTGSFAGTGRDQRV